MESVLKSEECKVQPDLVLTWSAEMAAWQGARRKIFERLLQGPVTNVELNAIAFRYSSRLFEIRQALALIGWSVDTQTISRGVNSYRLVPLATGKEPTASAA